MCPECGHPMIPRGNVHPKEFNMGNNEIMAIANAREIEKLPYETLKALFPSVRYMVQGGKVAQEVHRS